MLRSCVTKDIYNMNTTAISSFQRQQRPAIYFAPWMLVGAHRMSMFCITSWVWSSCTELETVVSCSDVDVSERAGWIREYATARHEPLITVSVRVGNAPGRGTIISERQERFRCEYGQGRSIWFNFVGKRAVLVGVSFCGIWPITRSGLIWFSWIALRHDGSFHASQRLQVRGQVGYQPRWQ